MQTHSRRVTAFMADGTRYETTEPALDDIIKFIQETKQEPGRRLAASGLHKIA
jgi:hypothetical protein